jgi:hypothetical protein
MVPQQGSILEQENKDMKWPIYSLEQNILMRGLEYPTRIQLLTEGESFFFTLFGNEVAVRW